MSSNKTYISEEGLKKLKDELRSLKTQKRREIADRIEEAKKLFCDDDLFHKIECDLNTAEIYFLRGELDSALKLYKKAKEDFAEIDTDPRDMADVDLHIAEIYKKRKDFKNAVIHYEMAKFNFEQSGDFEEAGETDESIRECINKMR